LRDGGIRIAAVTSNAKGNVRRILGPAAASVDGFGSGASSFGKARKFRAAVRAAGVTPDQAIGIGDETRDIEAAREAGIAAGAVLWGYAPPEALARFTPHHSVTDFAAIADLILGRKS
jgi:phosphoglycolate phosphatase